MATTFSTMAIVTFQNIKSCFNTAMTTVKKAVMSGLNFYLDILCSTVKVPGHSKASKYATWFFRLIVASPVLYVFIICFIWFCKAWMFMVDFINFVRWGC